MDRLSGRVAIVTGAAGGIGRVIGLAMVAEGAKVVVSDLQPDGKGGETVRLIKEAGGEALLVPCDVSRESQVKALIGATTDMYGRLDVLVNNAGVQRYKPLRELTEVDLDFMIATNIKGVFFGTQYAVPAMIASGGGSIINTASIAGDRGQHMALSPMQPPRAQSCR